jgi:GntR family transcriptional regulator
MSLHFQIDPHSGLPVYRQMIDQIKYYVASGTLRPGSQLPSVRELAQQLAVNPTTVVKAYTELQHEEVIELRHGKGAFVVEPGAAASEIQKDKVVRRLARQLAVESQQIGADYDFVDRILQEEWQQLSPAMQQMRKAAGG